MSSANFTWPLDPTGLAPSNLIPAEIKNLSPVNGGDFYFFIPDATPYHENSMKIVHVATGRSLTKNVDWEPSHPFEAASDSYEQLPIFGSVTILDRSLSGSFRIEYQTLGGEFTLDEQAILELLQNTMADPRTTTWDSVINRPAVYDPNGHLHHVTDTGSYEAMVAAFQSIAQALRDTSAAAMDLFRQHIDDLNNPHQTNLMKLGIQRFAEVYKATMEIALLGEDDKDFMTAALVKAAITQSLAGFEVDIPLPTLEELGLENIPNWPIASVQDLDNQQQERFIDPAQVYYIVNKVIQALPLAGLSQLIQDLNDHIANFENPHDITLLQLAIPKAINMTGSLGQIAYYDGEGGPFSMVADGVVNRLAIVHNAAELQQQQAATEDFAGVFNTWRRIAMASNNPIHAPTELNGWVYNSALGRVESTINSATVIGLVSPEPVVGDYVFEVEVSSSNADDDAIGILLGLGTYEGRLCNLVAMIDRGGLGTAGVTKLTLTFDYAGASARGVAGLSENLTFTAGGWAAVNSTGPMKIRAVRTGSQLVISVSNPGTDYVSSMSVDLAAAPDTAIFAGPVNLGYCAYSQSNATWKTLRRTGALPQIAALHTGAVYDYNGQSYVQNPALTLRDVIKAGRWYYNQATYRLYHSPTTGVAILKMGSAGSKDRTSPLVTRDRIVYSDNDNVAHMGDAMAMWVQHPTTGIMTRVGTMRKTSAIRTDWLSEGAVNNQFMLGNSSAALGGLQGNTAGIFGFIKADGSWYAYFDTAGKLQHYGMNRLSDETVKEVYGLYDYDRVWDKIQETGLDLHMWVWKDDDRIPEQLRNTEDTGVLAQKVEQVFPNCVSVNSETGLKTVDEAKFSYHLSLVLLNRIRALETKE